MTSGDPNADRSFVGPLLVLLAGLAFTGLMLFQLIDHLRFVFTGVPVQAHVVGGKNDGRRITLRYSGEKLRDEEVDLEQPDSIWDQFRKGDDVAIRFLP